MNTVRLSDILYPVAVVLMSFALFAQVLGIILEIFS